MFIEWTKHLKTEEEQNKFKQQILSSRDVLDRLKLILEEKEKALDRSEISITAYETSPNWAYRQAHKNGNRESLNFLKTLVDLDIQKGTK